MVRWLRWHCSPDTGFEIRALAVWGRARYLSVTEAPHNTDFHTWMGKKHFCFFQTAETGNRTPNSGVKGSGANHYPRAPAHHPLELLVTKFFISRFYLKQNFIVTYIDTADKKNDPMLGRCWTTVYDVGPTLNQHWVVVSCLLGRC